MRHERAELNARELTLYEKVERVAFLGALIVLLLDVLFWRAG